MEIHKVPINTLTSPDWNPRQITEEELHKLENSLKEFGYIEPIIVNDVNNHIVGGNQRCKALQKLGYKEVDVVYVHIEDLAKEKACNVALNKISGDWDNDKLQVVLEEIKLSPFDISLTGFDEIELTELEINEPVEVTEDDYTEPDDLKVTVQQGDIYQLGNHRIMCGDSTKEEDVAKLMNVVAADMVFTDPPYGYEYQSNKRKKTEKFDVIINDDKKLDFMPIVKKFNNGFVFVCTTWKVLKEWLEIFTEYYDLSNMIIWDKGRGGSGDLKHTFATDYEIILCSNNNQEITGKRIGSVWNISTDNVTDYVHPTQKPVGLSATAIQNTTNENDNILDLFGGSGSTLIACEQLNRNCYMMELYPQYCQVIINRWEEFTGEKATKIN